MAHSRVSNNLLMVMLAVVFVPVCLQPGHAYDLRNMQLYSHLSINDSGGLGDGNDLWGWTDPATSREYALVGRRNGTVFIDVTDPRNPEIRGTMFTSTGGSVWRDIKVYDNHAYVVSDNNGPHGVQIFDLTRLRGNATNRNFNPDSTYRGVRSAHNITINEETGFAYVTDGSILDLSNPTNPVDVGTVATNTHDTHAVVYQGSDTSFQGKEILFSFTGSSIQIHDVDQKSNISQLSEINVGNFEHQGWLSEDHNYLYVNAEQDLSWTYILDVSDLSQPTRVGRIPALRNSYDHNLYVEGDRVFAANYASGLRVFDIVDPSTADLREVAHIDTYLEDDSLGFHGAWSVYPWFESGNIIVNDTDYGLYVVGFDFTHGDFDGSGDTDLADIDMLTRAIADGSPDISFDMNADGVVDFEDVQQWLAVGGANAQGSRSFFLNGDANLDGVVDGSDFNIWNQSKFQSGTAWSSGDFNADGVTDGTDFNVWNANKFTSSRPTPQPIVNQNLVPEPGGYAQALSLFLLLVGVVRRQQR